MSEVRTAAPISIAAQPTMASEVALEAIVVLGILLRVYHFAARRSLWIDEARLALGILSRGYADLLRPLDYDQSAPPAFLWLTRLATRLFGTGELALRAVAFVGGIAALLLLYYVTRRLLSGFWARAFVLCWGALGPQMVYYSNELKPYSLDLLVNLLLTALALPLVMDRAPPARRRLACLLAAGVLAPWFSAPAVFTLGAVVVAMVVRRPQGGASPGRTAALAGAWSVSAAGAYGLVYRAAAGSAYMRDFWSVALVRIGEPGGIGRLAYSLQDILTGTFLGIPTQGLVEVAPRPALYALAVLLLLLIALGWRSMERRIGIAPICLIVVPFLGAVGASCVGEYPLGFRLTLFAVPSLLWGAGAGLEQIIDESSPRLRSWLWSAAALALLSIPLRQAVRDTVNPLARENVRAAVDLVRTRASAGVAVYILPGALPTWVYYTTDWSHPDTARLRRAARVGSSGGVAFENASLSELPPGDADSTGLEGWLGGQHEIWGRASGIRFRQGWDSPDFSPASSWAAREAIRIRSGGPVVWLVVAHTLPYRVKLYEALRARGGRLQLIYDSDEVVVVRCTFS